MGSSRWRQWFARIGPGAIIASLTIGSGELVFSTRAGSLFGYPILFIFLLICLLKWMLVYTTSLQMVLTGRHPFENWIKLPGPAGWLPMTFLLLAIPCFPIWVAFHASTVGSLIAHLAGIGGGWTYAWAGGILAVVLALSILGSYQKLERIQMGVVGLMLCFVIVAVLLLKPDWLEVLKGMIWPGAYAYPTWIEQYPVFKERPVWIELTTYVGVIGGSSYGYLCYAAFVREKGWGNAAVVCDTMAPTGRGETDWCSNPGIQEGIRNLRWDSIISFLCVFLFSVVFVVCGHLVMAPQSLTPTGGDLLTLQGNFVSEIYPGLRTLYFAGALLAMFGTLYGTLEVGPTIVQEAAKALGWTSLVQQATRWRKRVLTLIATGAFLVLGMLLLKHLFQPDGEPVNFVWILTPANLFTGVMGCGIIFAATLWMTFVQGSPTNRTLKGSWAIGMSLGGLFFFSLGIKGYWEHSGFLSFLILGGSLVLGALCAWIFRKPR
jgi:Mn2+/Fe2+ NRAMP family transporter